MDEAFSRTARILGPEAMERLKNSRVAVFGLGGVGGYVAEALARSGVGALDLIDSDVISPTNLNRQILALRSTLGMAKTEAAARRMADINPDCMVRTYRVFFLPGENDDLFDFSAFDYVVDAVDTVTAKLGIILAARAAGTRVISAMGTGNKLDPSALRVDDISRTSVCPLARIMRKELRKRGVERLTVVWSPEEPLAPAEELPLGETPQPGRRDIPGSAVFVPAAAGLLLASHVVRDLAGPG